MRLRSDGSDLCRVEPPHRTKINAWQCWPVAQITKEAKLKIIRVIAGLIGLGLLLLAIPGLLLGLHDTWFQYAFHILSYGALATYAIYFSCTGKYNLIARNNKALK